MEVNITGQVMSISTKLPYSNWSVKTSSLISKTAISQATWALQLSSQLSQARQIRMGSIDNQTFTRLRRKRLIQIMTEDSSKEVLWWILWTWCFQARWLTASSSNLKSNRTHPKNQVSLSIDLLALWSHSCIFYSTKQVWTTSTQLKSLVKCTRQAKTAITTRNSFLRLSAPNKKAKRSSKKSTTVRKMNGYSDNTRMKLRGCKVI